MPSNASPDLSATRRRAATAVDLLAARLVDPAHVATITTAPDNLVPAPDSPPGQGFPAPPDPRSAAPPDPSQDAARVAATPWVPDGLTDGHPGVAVLFAELGAVDGSYRRVAHTHLAAAVAGGVTGGPARLYRGVAALAFVGHLAAAGAGGYAGLLADLDREVSRRAGERARLDRARVLAGEPVGSWAGYDVLDGATGTGRLLLARLGSTAEPGPVGEALAEVLTTLVTFADAGEVADGRPAWWSGNGGGHLNLGLAHGIGGPLALLAAAHRAGVAPAGTPDAAEHLVALLSRWRRDDGRGPYWPRRIPLDMYRGRLPLPPRDRDVWCHGAAGIGRALHLAGTAFDRPEWTALAHAAVHGAVRTAIPAHPAARDPVRAAIPADAAVSAASRTAPRHSAAATIGHAAVPGPAGIPDHALCHGWAGLLQVVSRMAWDTGDPGYRDAADVLAARVLDGIDPDAPFGCRFPYPGAARRLDRPGLLDGAAGVALALHAHATGPPRTPWDAALLLT